MPLIFFLLGYLAFACNREVEEHLLTNRSRAPAVSRTAGNGVTMIRKHYYVITSISQNLQVAKL